MLSTDPLGDSFDLSALLGRCGKDEFNPRGQLFFTPLVQAMRMIIHLGETVPEATDQLVYHISAGTLVLWTITVFCLMLLTFGIGAASGVDLAMKREL